MLDDPRVKAATLTGSEPAGAQVAAQAGRQIKKTVLELGGSDPFIVMPSADLDRAVRHRGGGARHQQRPILHRRQALHRRRADRRRFRAPLRRGHGSAARRRPHGRGTQLGPLATPEILEGLDQQVRRSVEMGARLLTGGHRLDRPGNFYAPTVLADVPEDSPAYREELFGPVAVLSSMPAASTMPSAWPTTPNSAWAPASGPPTMPSSAASSTRSRPAWCSSTAWWPRTRACPSAA